ncbi:MAG: signal recognition particle subunit SRP19/SEC65 family protein [Candidatus Helarchaeota archaeon]
MKKRNFHYFYPAYFDKKKTRREGRRVHLKLASENPTIDKLIKAAARLNYNYKFDDKAYSRDPWSYRGRLAIEKTNKKSETLKKLAKMLKKVSKK